MIEKIRVGINGYGVIGKRVADAVALQDDMELIGVSDVVIDYLHKTSRPLLFELLVPSTPGQMVEMGSSRQRYDSEIRPDLMVAAMKELQQAGIEPSI